MKLKNTFIAATMIGATMLVPMAHANELNTDTRKVTTGHASAMASTTLNVTFEQLEDSTGLVYVGGLVSKEALLPYLAQMKALEPSQFETLRNGQKTRDHNKFHITLINPYEYKELSTEQQAQLKLKSEQSFEFSLIGLGRVIKKAEADGPLKNGVTYFVVAESEGAQALRTSFGFKEKDFHATLGFSPSDIFGVRKDRSALIHQGK